MRKCARVINCDRVHLSRWCVCTFFFVIIMILLKLHLCVWVLGLYKMNWTIFLDKNAFISKEPLTALFSHQSSFNTLVCVITKFEKLGFMYWINVLKGQAKKIKEHFYTELKTIKVIFLNFVSKSAARQY